MLNFDDDSYIINVLKYGAKGYLLKGSSPPRIMDAIGIVHEGGVVMQDLAMNIIKNELSADRKGSIPEGVFTDRELEITRLIAKGLSNREIASALFMSEGTIKNYISTILDKTGLEHRLRFIISRGRSRILTGCK